MALGYNAGMPVCTHCNLINSEAETVCERCRKPLPPPQPTTTAETIGTEERAAAKRPKRFWNRDLFEVISARSPRQNTIHASKMGKTKKKRVRGEKRFLERDVFGELDAFITFIASIGRRTVSGRHRLSLHKQDKCLECDYSLLGLPERHKCPECGAGYDLRTLVWRARRSWTVIFSEVLLILVLVEASVRLFDRFDITNRRTVVFIVIVFAGLSFIAHGIWRTNRLRRFAAVSPDGIRVHTKDLSGTWTWGEEKGVRMNLAVPRNSS